MNLKLLTTTGVLTPILLAFGVAVAASGSGALDPVANSANCLPALDPAAQVSQVIKDLTPAQLGHAKTIYDVSVGMKLPVRAAVVAMATVAQESYFKNMANSNVPKSLTIPHESVGSDHDSVGLFQQRPLPPDGAGGWGTVEELMTPRISATKFYSALRRIDGWEQLPITVAAQRVQVSAFPEAYAKHEPLAIALVTTIAGGAITCVAAGQISASGWTKPVNGEFTSGFRTPDRPTHNGVDVAAPKGTPIFAASTGVVISVRCDSAINCDVDGSIGTPGCGWFVELLHADRTTTRYCHMLRRPFTTIGGTPRTLVVGQMVGTGQQIGIVGTSGNSSGPHLHFETHLGNPPSSEDAQDPFVFMKARGVNL